MLNLKREYIALENYRSLYPVKAKDKAICTVFGSKKNISNTDRDENTSHSFVIPKDFWTFNAGQIDFTMYPDGIWNHYKSISIVQAENYFAPEINFSSMGDITPENLQNLTEHLTTHISNLEKRLVEHYMYIDEGVADITGLPNLAEDCFWVKKEGTIVGVNLKYLKDDFEYYKKQLEQAFKEISDKAYKEVTEKLLAYYEELVIKFAQELTVLEEDTIKNIKEKIDIYFEVDVKDSISEYVRQKEVEILEFIEANKANLKGERGLSVDKVELINQGVLGNTYAVKLEDGRVVGEILAPKGESVPGPEGPPGPQGNTGVVIDINSQYAFTVNEEGFLILHYMDGATPPDFSINSEGHLILNL